MKLTGAQALIKALEMEGVEVMFGLPGGCILPAYDPLLDRSIRHILVRHEQGAGHMAEGYAHVTGRPGVAMVTSGPAATNMVTPLCDAYMDSIPMVCITGQVPTTAIGTDAFQECDTVGITRTVTKHNELVMTAQDLPLAVRQAFHIATTGRPGPTLIDVPKDVLQNTMEWYWPTDAEVADSLPGYRPNMKGHPRMIKEAAKLILAGERPILYVGGGILKARAAEALRELAELTEHPRRHHADGPRRVPRRPSAVPRHARHARQRHRDHGAAEGRPADHARRPLRRPHHRQGLDVRARGQDHPRRHRSGRAGQGAPARRADRRRLPAGDRGAHQGDPATSTQGADAGRHGAWKSRISGWREQFPLTLRASEPGEALKPQFCLEQLRDNAPEGTILGQRRRPAPDVVSRSTGGSTSRTRGSTPVASARWASACRPRSAPRSAGPTAPCGPSTATAASR